ncbi:ATP-binding protein [Olleya sp. HaHaR_3_96]|uniref:ATP-binding protein n=1 Tax=Olleya sp. HaHaR_3_96 TaxID=2745560 RepID=UPI001C4F4328|nr:ATP-binding protein [Olleya sp. HaHaR_3_96]QXP60430.1 ATP-binding protein [Olleya sp. HaHaR_3_96]
MQKKIIVVPSHLIFDQTLNFINTFKNLREEREYVFDFKNLNRIDPFSLLCLSSEMAIFKKNNTNSKFSAKNFEHRTYEAHMGFFKSFGLNFGKTPGEANNNDNYIPITLYSVQEILEESRELMIPPGEFLTNKAEEISKVLTRNSNNELKEVLTYSIREIFRNIVEHSHTDTFGFCAQYLPSKNKVVFAVLDRGIGIKKSLTDNPKLNLNSDKEAISKSLEPGVSGKIYAGQKRKPKGEWANSGYGLYMTSNICKKGGLFFIASNTSGLLLGKDSSKEFEFNLTGTGLSLTINTNSIDKLNDMLKELRDIVPRKVKIKASKSSMNKS